MLKNELADQENKGLQHTYLLGKDPRYFKVNLTF